MRHRAFTVIAHLAASLSPQLVQADAFERTEILQRLGYIQCRQKFNGGLEIQSAELVWHLAVPRSAGGGIAPGPDHGKNIVRGSVNGKLAKGQARALTNRGRGRSGRFSGCSRSAVPDA